MHDLPNWNRLDAAAFRVSIKRSVRRVGIFLAVVGALVAAAGVAGHLMPWVVAGVVLAGAGVWNACRPAFNGLLIDGVATISTGIFVALLPVWMVIARESEAVKSIVTGLIQFAWGIRRLIFYRTARYAPDDAPAIACLESLVKELSRRRAKDDPSVVEFRTGRVPHRNRLGLYAEGVIGLLEQAAVRLETRADISIEARGTTMLGRSIKVAVLMSDLELTGMMTTEHFERFERWKLGLSPARSVAA